MSAEGVDLKRRRVLTIAVSAVGAVGVGYALVPFVASMNPSARAKAMGAPVEADISKLEPGQLLRVKWRGNPVCVLRRTEQNLKDLPTLEAKLADPESAISEQPEYCKNAHRSRKPELLVAIGICTHLGCSPSYRPDVGAEDLGKEWKGGFFCPCHGSTFDLAGRVYAGVPAPKNLVIPPYRFISDTLILIGDDGGAA